MVLLIYFNDHALNNTRNHTHHIHVIVDWYLYSFYISFIRWDDTSVFNSSVSYMEMDFNYLRQMTLRIVGKRQIYLCILKWFQHDKD